MQVRRVVGISLFLIAVITSTSASQGLTFAASRSFGVQAGQFATYKVVNATSTVGFDNVTVLSANSTRVTVRELFKGVLIDTVTFDVLAGPTSVPPPNSLCRSFLCLLAANLTPGDVLYPSIPNFVINSTTSRDYAGASRTVNLLNLTVSGISLFWDQQTGILTELDIFVPQPLSFTLVATNIWSTFVIPELPIGTILAAILPLAALILYTSRQRQRESLNPTASL